MKKKRKIQPIPPELKERFERNQRRLVERVAELERKIAAREAREAPPQP